MANRRFKTLCLQVYALQLVLMDLMEDLEDLARHIFDVDDDSRPADIFDWLDSDSVEEIVDLWAFSRLVHFVDFIIGNLGWGAGRFKFAYETLLGERLRSFVPDNLLKRDVILQILDLLDRLVNVRLVCSVKRVHLKLCKALHAIAYQLTLWSFVITQLSCHIVLVDVAIDDLRCCILRLGAILYSICLICG